MLIAKQIQITKTAPVAGGTADLGRLARELQAYNLTVQAAIAGNTKSGTLVIDNGTARLTLTFAEGKLSNVVSAASSGAALTWTAA